MEKIVWFSRHPLTETQKEDLAGVLRKLGIENPEVLQIDRTIRSIRDIAEDIGDARAFAVVAPLHLQVEFLNAAGERPVLVCRNHRVLGPDGSVSFHHAGWTRLLKIEIATEELSTLPAPEKSGLVRQKK